MSKAPGGRTGGLSSLDEKQPPPFSLAGLNIDRRRAGGGEDGPKMWARRRAASTSGKTAWWWRLYSSSRARSSAISCEMRLLWVVRGRSGCEMGRLAGIADVRFNRKQQGLQDFKATRLDTWACARRWLAVFDVGKGGRRDATELRRLVGRTDLRSAEDASRRLSRQAFARQHPIIPSLY